MMAGSGIFHADYREFPYWWEAYEPHSERLNDVPRRADVAIIGAGYAGLATALELSRHDIEAVVFDAEDPGFGASTRSGGLVGGAGSVKSPLLAPDPTPAQVERMSMDSADALRLFERLLVDEDIDCGWHKTGRFTGAWSKRHYGKLVKSVSYLNTVCGAGAEMVPVAEQRKYIGSDFYRGGLVIKEAGHLHPAQYFGGLLSACERRGITVCGKARVEDVRQTGDGWQVKTTRGVISADMVVVATNGYTGGVTPALQRRVVPLQPYVIATEPLPADLARYVSPQNMSMVDTRRIVSFFRLSPDGTRMVFGSRVKWCDLTPTQMAPFLFDMVAERYPQLRDAKITHAWTGQVAITMDERPHIGQRDGLFYALGCNGSGVAMMTYLGTQLALKMAGKASYRCAFDTDDFPDHPLYNGKSRWFLPPVGNYLRLRDWIDRKLG
jgi:glycine/D-amino acid oxidase-like deaminating enzyme